MTALVVRPVRFTDDVVAMRVFLEVVGLRSRIESVRGGWVDMVAGAGMVALHTAESSASGAEHGETRLSFEAEDVDALATQLKGQGVANVAVYDEAYGLVLTCVDPLGDVVQIDARSTDLYGYRLHQARADSRLRVRPVRFTDLQGLYGGFLEALGLSRRRAGDEYFSVFAGEGEAGEVGLHYQFEGELPIVDGPAAVHLTFATTEVLDEVAARLRAAGYSDAEVTTDEFVSRLSVTDPDGRNCEIYES